MLKRIFNMVGWVGVAIVVAGVLVRVTRPEMTRVWNGLLIAGLVCVVLYLASQWREILTTFAGRSARYGALSGASVLLVLAILVGINYIGARQNKRWDLTAAGQYSLSDQTKKVLAGLKQPVQLTVFDQSKNFDRFRDRLDSYTYVSPQVKIEYVDVDKNPLRAQQEQVQQYGTVVIKYQGRTERVTTDTEQDITNGIIKAVEGQQKKVYFVQGHGEKDPANSDQRAGYNTIAAALGRDNFAVERLVLAQQGSVPADASVVIVAGPTTDYLAPEVDALRKYLNQGGKLLLMLDPPEGRVSPTPNLAALAKEWGFELGDNVVVDVSGIGRLLNAGPSVPVAANYPTHPITDNFNVITAFPLARSVSPVSGGVQGRFAQPFVETSAQSWAETDMKALAAGTEVAFDEKSGDKRGPITIAAAVSADAPEQPPAAPPAASPAGGAKPNPEPQKKQTRVAVVGDSDFASNGVLGVSGNRDLFLNTVNWLAQQENLISIRPREPQDRRITMTADAQKITFYLTVLVIPALVIGAGVFTWWRRR